jgi:diguanylate cyclase (GGDEF)-like protein
MFRFWRDTIFLRIILVVILSVLIYFFFLSKLNPFDIAKLKTIDIFARISYELAPKQENIDKIAIIAIDERSFRSLNKRWPWDRDIFAQIVNKLQTYGPKLICFDFSFMGESDNRQDDIAFAEAIKRAGNVIVASHFGPRGEYMIPEKILAEAALTYGFINKPRDKDFYARRARIFYFSKNGSIIDLSLELKAICKYLNINSSRVLYNPHTRVLRLPKDEGQENYIKFQIRKDGTIPINFQAHFEDFTVIPFWEVLKRNLPKDTFRDKIVLVSLTSEISHDMYNTTLGVMPGATIIANKLLMFLNNTFIKEIPPKINFIILLFFTLITTFVVYKVNALKGFIFSFAESLVFIGMCIYLYLKNYWADFFSPLLFIGLTYLGISAQKYIQLAVESAHLKTLAITDGLTGLFVHRYFKIRLENEFARILRYNLNLSLLILDIDHFKRINDTYGHLQGNAVLKSLSEILQQNSRKADVLVRYGGEEFCIILPHTNQEGAAVYAERIRKAVEDFDFKILNSSRTMKVTVSVGVASFPDVDAQSAEDLIRFADTALYQAKESGRNRVCIAKSPRPQEQ